MRQAARPRFDRPGPDRSRPGRLEIIYDRGQENDWFNSRLILVLTVLVVVSLSTAVAWELRHPNPVVNLRLLKDRNFAAGSLVMFVVFCVLYGSNVLCRKWFSNSLVTTRTRRG